LKYLFRIIAQIFNWFYGYEGLNVLLRITPSVVTVEILKYYGATIGKNVRIQSPMLIHNADQIKPIYKNLIIGDNCYIGRDCIIDLMGKININSNVTISHRVTLNTHTNAGKSLLNQHQLVKSQGDITFGNDVYIGTGVTILENIEIGEKSIIGASSLVTKSIPPNSKAFGVPCKVQESIHDN